MPFVKLDCGILNSTLWFEREAREVFITALLMAEPFETTEPLPQIAIGSLEYTGWSVPPGWYGFVSAAGVGILHRARVPDDIGMEALRMLGEPEPSSRSPEFDGRRLVRVDGGFIVLNYMKYRERDYTGAERSKRYREKKMRDAASRRDNAPSHRDITQAEAEVEVKKKISERKTAPHPDAAAPGDRFARFWSTYPNKKGKGAALKAWTKIHPSEALADLMIVALEQQKTWLEWTKDGGQFVPHPATWLNRAGWDDEPYAAVMAQHEARPHSQNGSCPHVPSCETTSACNRRIINEGRAAEGRPLL